MDLCDIPDQARPIADIFCRSAEISPCVKLPCSLIYMSSATNENITCSLGGRKTQLHRRKDIIECVKSPALELFLKGPTYPSVIVHGQYPIDGQLFGDSLSKKYRSPDSIWALRLFGESISYYPWSGSKSILSLFDITWGYDRHLYHIATNEYLMTDQDRLTTNRISFEAVLSAKKQVPSYVTSPVLWINSNCATKSNRTGYMRAFNTVLRVDAWGNCGRNKGPALPPEIAKIHEKGPNVSHYEGNWGLSKMALAKNYLFIVAIENSFNHDYVTEKLWQALAAGSVPLYHGAPNIYDWLPCDHCIVDLRQFPSPEAAAEFVSNLANNLTRYAEYHQWRTQPILPKFQKILDYFQRTKDFSIDCITCCLAHSAHQQSARYEILKQLEPIFGSYQ